MGKKINTDFLAAFIELETACNEMLGTKRSGVTEYINRLSGFKSAPEREEVLPKLISYRGTRNKLAHEEGALTEINNLDRSDVRWLKAFKKKVKKGRDPVSVCIRKSERSRRGRLAAAVAIAAAFVAVLIAALILIIK